MEPEARLRLTVAFRPTSLCSLLSVPDTEVMLRNHLIVLNENYKPVPPSPLCTTERKEERVLLPGASLEMPCRLHLPFSSPPSPHFFHPPHLPFSRVRKGRGE